jgi:DNA-binding MarR family transcriptional regulator
MSAHPRTRLDPLLQQPIRLSILAALAGVREAEFTVVRDGVQISDSLLSRYMTQLEGAGYVVVRKGYVGKRPRTWLALSDDGREAFARQIAALQEIAGTVIPTPWAAARS